MKSTRYFRCCLFIVVCFTLSCGQHHIDYTDQDIEFEDSAELSANTYLGISFEDFEDYDYNDIVLCMLGSFSVDSEKGIIRSLTDQNSNVYFKRNTSEENHVLRIYDNDTSSVIDSFSQTDYGQEIFKTITLRENQNLKIRMINHVRDIYIDLTNKRAKVEEDTCRISGI